MRYFTHVKLRVVVWGTPGFVRAGVQGESRDYRECFERFGRPRFAIKKKNDKMTSFALYFKNAFRNLLVNLFGNGQIW